MRMLRKLAALAAALTLCVTASAEVFTGVTAALSTVNVVPECFGTSTSLDAEAGQRVVAGQSLMTLSSEKTFAAADGTVSLLHADEGEDVDGTVLEIAPMQRYVIHCTVTQAYQSAENTLVHDGETVYARCTQDGTHRAVGTVCAVDGSTYRVLTTGGELYVGEVVYLYRGTDFTAARRVGIGTVMAADPVAYEGSGKLTRLCVDEGDPVERGQLLYALGGGTVEAPVSGIVTGLDVQPGESVEKDQIVAQIVPDGQVGVEVQVDEATAARVEVGAQVQLVFATDDGQIVSGTVIDCARTAEDGAYRVRIQVDTDAPFPLGMSITVWM